MSILDESGHWPMADDPAVLQARLLPFLERMTSSSRGEAAERQVTNATSRRSSSGFLG